MSTLEISVEDNSLEGGTTSSPLHEISKVENNQPPRQQIAIRSEQSTWVRDIFQIRSDAEYDEAAEPSILLLLFALGCSAGLINGLILWASSALSQLQVVAISADANHSGIGLVYFWISSSCCAFAAACMCKFISPHAAGSGLPEFKYLLATEMNESEYNRYLSGRVFVAKVFGLVLSSGSSLSIGSEGPLVHTAASIAFLLMKYIGEFGDIMQSPSLLKQVFAASAAVGVSSAFNAPVGGLLFSIEVTSTFYLVSNYWKSFIAAVAGSVACNIFLISKGATSDPLLTLQMEINPHPFVKAELIIFTLIGVTFGYSAHFFLKLHQKVNEFIRPYNKAYPLICVTLVVIFTSSMIYVSGAYNSKSVGVIAMVSDVLTNGRVTEMTTSSPPVSHLGGLLISIIVRCVLTLLGTNIPIPAGIFMPVFLIGGLMGRFVGIVMHLMLAAVGNIDISAYALVGACAFAAGVTHTISVAVIAVEMTGNIHMLLPCLLVSVIAAGITKASGPSVYDRGMLNKGLESIQLLLMDSATFNKAGDIMDNDIYSIPRNCSLANLINLMQASLDIQEEYPIIESLEGREIVGSVSRTDLYLYLESKFSELDELKVLRFSLPRDYKRYRVNLNRQNLKIASTENKRRMVRSFWTKLDEFISKYSIFGEEDATRSVHNRLPQIDVEDGRLPKNSDCAATSPMHESADTTSAEDNRSTRRSSVVLINEMGESVASILTVGAAQVAKQAELMSSSALGAVEVASAGLTGIARKAFETVDGPIAEPEPVNLDVLTTEPYATALDLTTDSHVLRVNSHPFSVAPETPMEQVYILFEMVKVPCVFIESTGHLYGMISRYNLLRTLKSKRLSAKR